MTIFLNVLFYNFLYFLGRGVFLLPNFITDRKKQIKERILGFPVSTFYVVFGLIVFGNLGFILNFFIKLDSIIPIFFVTLPLVINLFYKLDIKDKTTKFITNIIIPSILSISSYNIGFHYDSGYYHLNFQNWLQKEKIVLGLSNIFQPFGLGSINDYISSLLWLDNNFILLHFVQLASIAAFYTFLVHLFIYSENLIDKVISVNILIFSILDNFGFGGGRNGFIYIQGVGKPDITFSIIFFIGFLLIFRLSSSEKIKSTDFLYLNWIVLFCFQLKVFGALLIIPYLYLLFLHKEKILKIIKQTRTFYIQVFVLISWSLKSLLLSGCIVFPVSQTCIENLNWFTPKLFNDFYTETKIFNKAFILNKLIDKNIGQDIIFSYKRASNILSDEVKKNKFELSETTDPGLFKNDSEKKLYKKIQEIRKYFTSLGSGENCEKTLEVLAEAKIEVSNFFEDVIVNDDDEVLKKNRLELLQLLCKTFNNYINFSNIESA